MKHKNNKKEANRQAQSLTPAELMEGVEQALKVFEPVPHSELLERLLADIQPVNFREKAELTDESDRLQRKHWLVICVEEILATASAAPLAAPSHTPAPAHSAHQNPPHPDQTHTIR